MYPITLSILFHFAPILSPVSYYGLFFGQWTYVFAERRNFPLFPVFHKVELKTCQKMLAYCVHAISRTVWTSLSLADDGV